MNHWTTTTVASLTLSDKELRNDSRKRKGFHVFLSRYYIQFGKLDIQEKLEILNTYNSIPPPNNSNEGDADADADDDTDTDTDTDSTDSPPTINNHDIMRVACSLWRSYNQTMKKSWNDRAIFLNGRPVPGLLTTFPTAFRQDEGVEAMIMELLHSDWKNLCRKIQSSIKRAPRNSSSSATYYFGNELVQIQSQTYRDVTLSSLLIRYLFGKNFEKVQANIVQKSKKRILLHVASNSRAKEILSIAGLCAATTESNYIIQSCCGKVIIEDNNGKEAIGYVLSETRSRWTITLNSNKQISCRAPFYDVNTVDINGKVVGGWVFSPNQRSNGMIFSIKEYSPIRILIDIRGELKYTFNRIAFRRSTRNKLTLLPQHCS